LLVRCIAFDVTVDPVRLMALFLYSITVVLLVVACCRCGHCCVFVWLIVHYRGCCCSLVDRYADGCLLLYLVVRYLDLTFD